MCNRSTAVARARLSSWADAKSASSTSSRARAPVLPGDRIRVELTGRYASGKLWGHGPLTLIAGDDVYPGSRYPLRVGSVIRMQYVAHAARTDDQPRGGGTPLERLANVSAFHDGHYECARLLVKAGANTARARERLRERLADKGPGGFGFSNRPVARRILGLLR
ncbi:MAG TPA: hypothetical protein VFW03_19590 [Gemmatimonadaceae bacterium]|nr:hypothetical protein [Gemmatimonadaceae bacterium]